MNCARIREAQASDLAQLTQLCIEHAAYERVSIESPSVSRLHTALFDQPIRLRAWVAECADELIGYATATVDFSTWSAREFMHLDCLYVREDKRGHGLGRLLLDAVIAHADARNIAEVQWQTPDWNVDAQRFYARLGASTANKMRFTLKASAVKSDQRNF